MSSLQDVKPPHPHSPSPPSMSYPPSDNISDHLIDDISIPISSQIFDFYDDSDIFQDTLQNSEVTSSPNCCNSYEDQNSPYNNNNIDTKTNKFTTNNNNNNTSTASSATIAAANHHSAGLPLIYDPQVDIDTDISASIDFSTPPLAYNFTTTSLPNHVAYSTSPLDPCLVPLPLVGGLGPVFEDESLSSIPPFLRLSHNNNNSCATFLEQQNGILNHGMCNIDRNNAIFGGNLFIASELQAKEIDFEGDNAGIFCSDQLMRYNSGDIQAFSNENSQLMNGATNNSTTMNSTEVSSLDDSSYKVGKLSVEQRKEKIHRYMKKRNERNFCKKIKYACRKTLADSRPRVRGRFAKNDELGEDNKHINDQHDEDDFDEVAMKEVDGMLDSSDIFAHISGVNSFKYNYHQIQSWM